MGNLDFFHSLTIEEVIRELKTSSKGLSQEEASRRLILYGRNCLEEERGSVWRVFFRQFHNPLVYVLMFASLISIAIGEWVDFFVINSVIIFNSLIGFWQEIKAEASLKALKKLTKNKNVVLRDGAPVQVQ